MDMFVLRALFIFFFPQCFGAKRMFKFNFQPGNTDHNLDGLSCAIELSQYAHGVKFDPTSNRCTTLTNQWAASPSFETGADYYVLVLYENIIQPTLSLNMNIPQGFGLGCSIIMYLRTGTFVTNGIVSIGLNKKWSSNIAMVAEVRLNTDIIIFNSFTNNQWGTEEILNNPLQVSDRDYKFEFKMNAESVTTFIDDVSFKNYTYRTSIDDFQEIVYSSDFTGCMKVEFVFPSYDAE